MASRLDGLGETLDLLETIKGEIARPELAAVGALIVSRISDRCDAGVTPSGSLGDYSKHWKRRREKAGRRVDVVNLQFTGAMLAAMTWKVEGSRVTALFSDQTQNDKAAFITAQGRNFFDIDSTDENDIVALIENGIKT